MTARAGETGLVRALGMWGLAAGIVNITNMAAAHAAATTVIMIFPFKRLRIVKNASKRRRIYGNRVECQGKSTECGG